MLLSTWHPPCLCTFPLSLPFNSPPQGVGPNCPCPTASNHIPHYCTCPIMCNWCWPYNTPLDVTLLTRLSHSPYPCRSAGGGYKFPLLNCMHEQFFHKCPCPITRTFVVMYQMKTLKKYTSYDSFSLSKSSLLWYVQQNCIITYAFKILLV